MTSPRKRRRTCKASRQKMLLNEALKKLQENQSRLIGNAVLIGARVFRAAIGARVFRTAYAVVHVPHVAFCKQYRTF